MNLIKLYQRRKAVSPVIAVVLLIALTVAAAGIIYFIVTDLLQPTPSLEYQETYADDVTGVVIKFKATQGDIVITGVTAVLSNGTTLVGENIWWQTGPAIPTGVENTDIPISDGDTIYLAIACDGDFPLGGTHTFEIKYLADGNNEYESIDVTTT
jgi:flagellin-like protein